MVILIYTINLDMNCKTKTRARNIALDDITSKSQWDRTFYPKKNTLIQKAAGLEICSGAQVRSYMFLI